MIRFPAARFPSGPCLARVTPQPVASADTVISKFPGAGPDGKSIVDFDCSSYVSVPDALRSGSSHWKVDVDVFAIRGRGFKSDQ